MNIRVTAIDVSKWTTASQDLLLSNKIWIATTAAFCASSTILGRYIYYKYIHDKVIFDQPIPYKDFPPSPSYDKRRHATYPSSYLNAWYHLCDSNELEANKMIEFHVVGQTLILWRKSDGTIVCQDAFCPHAGTLQ